MDLHYIVDKLNSAPFEYELSLLSLSEKSSQELLQLLSNVFSQISPKHQNVDVSKEQPDETADRLIKFLKMVKYKPPASLDPASFRMALAAGDKDTIFMILKWVVPQPEELQKRAFVGYYLSFPEMPDEFNYDGDIMELKEEIKMMQKEFVETHKANQEIKALNKDTSHMKKRIKSLEEEKERLAVKVEKARQNVDKIADRSQYMDVCSALRKQQDEEVALSVQMVDQKKKLEKTETNYVKVAARLRELQSSYQEGSASKLLETLAEDVSNLRLQVNERYPRELEKRQKRVAALQEALSNSVNTEVDLQRLQGKANGLHTQIGELQERRAQSDRSRQGDKAFLQLRQAQQMATMTSRKKDELRSKLERLQEKKATLTTQFEKLTASDGTVSVVSEEEWRQKFESMKSALPQYKRMKKELGDIEAEVFVLAYTEELLLEQEAALNNNLKATAKKHGVAGFTDVASDLEKVSEQKSAIDEVKGMTLQEISKTVEEINSTIGEKKVQLAPHLKELRQERQRFAELEAEYTASKQTYDAAIAQYEQLVGGVEGEVMGIKGEMMENESKFHMLHCQLAIADHNIKRVSSGPAAEQLNDKYQTEVTRAEQQQRSLKDRQKECKETHTNGLSQIDMMNDMIKLLQLKLDLKRSEMGLAPGAPIPGLDKADGTKKVKRTGGMAGAVLGGGAATAPRALDGLGKPRGHLPGGKEFSTASGADVFVME